VRKEDDEIRVNNDIDIVEIEEGNNMKNENGNR